MYQLFGHKIERDNSRMIINDFKFVGLDLPLFTHEPELVSSAIQFNRIRLSASLRDQWISELRSGKFIQAKMRLAITTQDDELVGMCCLGVLCHVAKLDYTIESDMVKAQRIFARRYYDKDGEDSTTTVPNTPLSSDFQNFLARLNDSGLWSFEQIATLIETIVEPINAE